MLVAGSVGATDGSRSPSRLSSSEFECRRTVERGHLLSSRRTAAVSLVYQFTAKLPASFGLEGPIHKLDDATGAVGQKPTLVSPLDS